VPSVLSVLAAPVLSLLPGRVSEFATIEGVVLEIVHARSEATHFKNGHTRPTPTTCVMIDSTKLAKSVSRASAFALINNSKI